MAADGRAGERRALDRGRRGDPDGRDPGRVPHLRGRRAGVPPLPLVVRLRHRGRHPAPRSARRAGGRALLRPRARARLAPGGRARGRLPEPLGDGAARDLRGRRGGDRGSSERLRPGPRVRRRRGARALPLRPVRGDPLPRVPAPRPHAAARRPLGRPDRQRAVRRGPPAGPDRREAGPRRDRDRARRPLRVRRADVPDPGRDRVGVVRDRRPHALELRHDRGRGLGLLVRRPPAGVRAAQDRPGRRRPRHRGPGREEPEDGPGRGAADAAARGRPRDRRSRPRRRPPGPTCPSGGPA